MAQALLDQIRRHGEEAYPEESCGILLGVVSGDMREVRETVRCRNVHMSPKTNYELDLREVIRLQREARERGLEIVGFYHSHPDHPASPSETDLHQAHWIGCSYMITSVERGMSTSTRSFALVGVTEEDKALASEDLIVSR